MAAKILQQEVVELNPILQVALKLSKRVSLQLAMPLVPLLQSINLEREIRRLRKS